MDRLTKFRCYHSNETKWVKQYCIEEIAVPGQMSTHIVVRRLGKGKDGMPGRIIVHQDQLFDAINEMHCQDRHSGQERAWTHSRAKYYNLIQNHVHMHIYCETCLTCMKKNPVTKNVKGSHKPICSTYFCDRFQVDLINFTKLCKRD